MIVAGLTLLAIGVGDLIRRFQPLSRRWIFFLGAALLVFLVGALLDAAVWALPAIAIAAIWIATAPPDGSGRAGLWPVGILALLAASAVVLFGPRERSIAFDQLWTLPGPGSAVPVDLVVLVLGAIAFLLESANIVVRTALRAEVVAGVDDDPRPTPALKGGRLIGPLERVLVFALMLAGAYTLIAAVLAAKGIVRFPEISRDSEDGNRAEYFLIGSLVSWVLALAAAFLVWWGAR